MMVEESIKCSGVSKLFIRNPLSAVFSFATAEVTVGQYHDDYCQYNQHTYTSNYTTYKWYIVVIIIV